jgi:hypothetical protein
MAQADGSCANASGSAFRADLNTQLAAVFTNHSGSTAPATTFAYQFWVDTSTNELKIRNSSNSAWITLRSVATGGITFEAGSITNPSLTFGSDGPDYGFYRYGVGQVAYVTQLSGADHTLFTLGKDAGDGPSLYWNQQVTAASSADNAANTSTLEGLQLQRRGRINIAFNNGPGLKVNRLGSSGTELGSVVQFHSNGAQAGRIGIVSASSVALVDSSDRRLKDNITNMPEAKPRINQIQMYRFRMIAADVYEEGFIAQELKTVVPDAVMGSETDIDDEGNIEYMGVAKSELVPLLMKGLQEAYAEITALTARVAALEVG